MKSRDDCHRRLFECVNNHRHLGSDVDGDGAIDYAVDTGSANAYVIALAPALAANVIGMLITFKATNANTGASTLNVNGIGAVAIKKNVSATSPSATSPPGSS